MTDIKDKLLALYDLEDEILTFIENNVNTRDLETRQMVIATATVFMMNQIMFQPRINAMSERLDKLADRVENESRRRMERKAKMPEIKAKPDIPS